MGSNSLLKPKKHTTGMSNRLLIPVDFSEMTELAVRVGFQLAQRLQLRPCLLYAYPVPTIEPNLYPAPMPEPDATLETMQAEEEISESVEIRGNACNKLDQLCNNLRQLQDSDKLAKLDFDSLIEAGMPEEVIREYCRAEDPSLVVMATRGKSKRKIQLIGSVTAEVIDNCRVPVFTVPEHYAFDDIAQIDRVAVFCNLEKKDTLLINNFLRMFGYPAIEVWLLPVADKISETEAENRIANILEECKNNFPSVEFKVSETLKSLTRSECEELFMKRKLQMIVAPNKKQNIFSRLFNPGIAHKILFEEDVPMLAIPV